MLIKSECFLHIHSMHNSKRDAINEREVLIFVFSKYLPRLINFAFSRIYYSDSGIAANDIANLNSVFD